MPTVAQSAPTILATAVVPWNERCEFQEDVFRRQVHTLARDLSRMRKLTLAGGLTPENVAEAIAVVQPYCVDVASGVESGTPGEKDLERVRAFIAAARSA